MAALVPAAQPAPSTRQRPSPPRSRSKPRWSQPQPEPQAAPSSRTRRLQSAALASRSSTFRLRRRSPGLHAPRRRSAQASAATPRPAFRRAALPLAKSINTVVQLAAYDSRAYVADGWNRMARRYASLRGYSPVVAKFNSPKGWSIACRSRVSPRRPKPRACASRSSARAPIASSARSPVTPRCASPRADLLLASLETAGTDLPANAVPRSGGRGRPS